MQANVGAKTPILEIKSVYKIFRRGKIDVVALKDLSCNFYPGEIAVIMGPSGCGKTTLINLIAGIDHVSSGQILIRGEDITRFATKDLDKYRQENIGIVFQFLNLIPQLSALENIMIPLLNNNYSLSERKSRANL